MILIRVHAIALHKDRQSLCAFTPPKSLPGHVHGTARFAFFILLNLLFLGMFICPVAALDWVTETVDSTGEVGSYNSQALDSSGKPRISYYDKTHTSLKYAAWDGSVWQKQIIIEESGKTLGLYTSLALDAAQTPHICYYYSTQGLVHAVRNGAAWTTDTVDNSVILSEGLTPSVALNESGQPRVVYYDLLAAGLMYAAWDGAAWQKETIDNTGPTNMYASLALDTSGMPRVSYYDATHKVLKYAKSDGLAWQIETVDSTGDVGQYSSLELDSSGFPHISYYDETKDDLKYAAWDGTMWQKVIVDSTGIGVGKFTSLALNANGNPRISYYNLTTLKFASRENNIWQMETVDNSSANVGQYTSLALDSSGNPHISYYDVTNKDLKYTHGYFPLTVNFSATPLTGTVPLTVQLTDSSTGGLPTQWNWSFGDGAWFNTSISDDRNPVHTYSDTGTFTINLTVQNFTSSHTFSRADYITVSAAPPAATTVPTTVVPTTVVTTVAPTTVVTTVAPTTVVTTVAPTIVPTTVSTTIVPTTEILTTVPTTAPTTVPTTVLTTVDPTAIQTQQSFTDTSDSGSNSIPPETSFVHIPAPEPATQTVNVGGDSAISRVTVTGQDVSDVVVTAIMVSSIPDNVPQIDATVYQHIEITPAHFTGISSATIEFGVPLSLIEEQHSTLAGIALSRFHDGAWTSLNTNLIKVENGHAWYRAESPGFSLFAIVITNAPLEESAVVMTPGEPAFIEPVRTSRISLEHPATTRTIAPQPAQPASLVRSLPLKTIIFIILVCTGIYGSEILSYWW